MELPSPLPDELLRLISEYHSSPIVIGESVADVQRLVKTGSPTYYLKTSAISEEMSLDAEARKLEWLRGRLSVPRVIFYLSDDRREYLLTSEIEGVDAAQWDSHGLPERVVTLLAEGLRMIHSLNIDGCPFDRRLDKALADAERQMKLGLVDVDNFDDERKGKSVDVLYKQLLSRRPDNEDLVFTHGDYCLPNIIICGDQINGFVDWSRGGVADRYQDLALAARSLEFNTASKMTEQLFEAYGIDRIDWEKVRYYTLLDEFF